jgi:hypothetical protein
VTPYVGLLLALVALPSLAGTAEENNGTDPTRPRPEVLTLYDFQNLPGAAPDSSSTFTLSRPPELLPSHMESPQESH